jgi:hypothetical protein
MTCICMTCIVLLWLIPHPIVIWLTYGSMECNKDFMYVCKQISDLINEESRPKILWPVWRWIDSESNKVRGLDDIGSQ